MLKTEVIRPCFCYYIDMKLYLSSYKLGNHAEQLQILVGKPRAKVAVCQNALDAYTDLERKAKSLQSEFDDMKSLGFDPEELDLCPTPLTIDTLCLAS